MILDGISTKLAELVPELIEGETLFQHGMPETVEFGALVRDNYPGGSKIDHELPGFRKFRFQVIVRAKDYLQGRALAQKVSSALTMGETEIPGAFVRYIRPRHDPISYPLSRGGVVEFSTNFDAACDLL